MRWTYSCRNIFARSVADSVSPPVVGVPPVCTTCMRRARAVTTELSVQLEASFTEIQAVEGQLQVLRHLLHDAGMQLDGVPGLPTEQVLERS